MPKINFALFVGNACQLVIRSGAERGVVRQHTVLGSVPPPPPKMCNLIDNPVAAAATVMFSIVVVVVVAVFSSCPADILADVTLLSYSISPGRNARALV